MPRKPYAANAILHAFRQSLGRSTARRELEWIKQGALTRNHGAIMDMVKARAAGRPLAYVLGECPSVYPLPALISTYRGSTIWAFDY